MDITQTKNIKNVLLVCCGTLSDVVSSTGAVDALRLEYGDLCEIDVLCSPYSAPLFDYDTRIRHVYTLLYEKLPFLLHWGKLSLVLKTLFHKYDLIINFETRCSFSSLISKLRATYKSGSPYAEAKNGVKWRYRHFKMQDFYRRYVSEKNLQRTNPSIQSAPIEPVRFKFNLPKEYIVIHPGNSYVNTLLKHRVWPEKYWKYLLYKLIKENYHVVITGSIEEKRLIKEKINIGNVKNVIDIVGKTTLPELAAILEYSRCVVTTDNAPAHIAGAVGATVILLCGPTNKYNGPVPDSRNTVTAINAELECSPCYGTPRMQGCRDNMCMKKITIKQVYEEVKKASGSYFKVR